MNTSIDKSNMKGPFLLKTEIIDKEIRIDTIGVYLLGVINNDGTIKPKYVGRSDNNLNKRLHDHEKENYPHFMYHYAGSIKDAFEMECRLYHLYGGDADHIDNKIHPDRPKEWPYLPCTGCKIFDSFIW
jgi:hypothetical protein